MEGSLEGMIKLTIDYPSNHMGGGGVPILDMEVAGDRSRLF